MRFATIIALSAVVFIAQADLYFPDWKQCYFAWGKEEIGKTGETLCTKGDATTSLAIYVSALGYGGNPKTLNNWLGSNGGYSGTTVVWDKIDDLGLNTNFAGVFGDFYYDNVCDALGLDSCVIAAVNACNKTTYVLLTDCKDHDKQTYTVRDPSECSEIGDTVQQSDIKSFVYYKHHW